MRNCVCPKLSYPNFLWAVSLPYVCCPSAFVHFVFTCAVAKKQNGRICKNTVLMETAFHSTSGFHLNPLIGENVTISVLLWKPWRERESERSSCLIFPQPSALSTTIKPKRRLSRVHEIECACNASSFQWAAACTHTPPRTPLCLRHTWHTMTG